MKKLFASLLVISSSITLSRCPCLGPLPQPQEQPAPIIQNVRVADYPVHALFVNRWSSRAMSGEEVSDQELNTLFEAARWAPSSFNEQPWHFLYVKRNDPYWQDFMDVLVPFNQQWVKNAGAIVLVLSKQYFTKNGQANQTHSFDTGAAWMQMALQGHDMQLVVHGMSGFDYQKAREELRIPECYTIEAMVAVGKKGTPDMLPEDLRSKEILSDRKKIEEFITHGPFLNC